MKPIAIIGDSWATGPAPGQPNLGETFAKFGIPSVMVQLMTTGEILSSLNSYIASGHTGNAFSMVLLSAGSHDIAQGIPESTIIQNLAAIGKDCAELGLKCEVIAFPKITTNGVDAWFPNPSHDWGGFDIAASECPNLQVLHGAVGEILEHFPAYENFDYSQYVPHYNQWGADALAIELVGIYDNLNGDLYG